MHEEFERHNGVENAKIDCFPHPRLSYLEWSAAHQERALVSQAKHIGLAIASPN